MQRVGADLRRRGFIDDPLHSMKKFVLQPRNHGPKRRQVADPLSGHPRCEGGEKLCRQRLATSAMHVFAARTRTGADLPQYFPVGSRELLVPTVSNPRTRQRSSACAGSDLPARPPLREGKCLMPGPRCRTDAARTACLRPWTGRWSASSTSAKCSLAPPVDLQESSMKS